MPSDAGEVILGNVTYAIVSGENISNMDVGIFVGFSKNIVIERNNISGFTWHGIYYGYTNYTRIESNIIFNGVNSRVGIYFYYSSNNVIVCNQMVNNTNYGVYIYSGSNNRIYNNTFAYNNGSNGTYNASHIQAYDSGTNNNDTNDQNHDGIVDWPYKIDGGNSEDHFPLKNATEPTPVPELNTIYVYCAMLMVLVFVFMQRKSESQIKIF